MEAVGLRFDGQGKLRPGQHAVVVNAKDRQALHRYLSLGTGFYPWMARLPETKKSDDWLGQLSLAKDMRPLPTTNFLDFGDATLANAIVEEALPQDRARFRRYLTDRPLGLGLVAAGPGTGKTTCIAAITLAMRAKLGPIACTAPTNAAVDNFAKRICVRSRAVAERCNKELGSGCQGRYRHLLVVRVYTEADETNAFKSLLQDPSLGSRAGASGQFKDSARWTLPLSVAYWALSVLGSPAGEELHVDASEKLWGLRSRIDASPRWRLLRDVANGTISYDMAVSQQNLGTHDFSSLMGAVASAADMLCSTPATFESHTACKSWLEKVTRGVAADEAANMHRADLFSVWGNCLLPCFLCGDTKQLAPSVMSHSKTLSDGNPVNQFAQAGKISPLLFLMGMGYPVYRLEQQLRMGNGLFDAISSLVYPEVTLSYASSCDVDKPHFKIGHDLEAFMGSETLVDLATGSMYNKAQVKVGLGLVADFVNEKKVDPARIAIIAPYRANIAQIKHMRKTIPAYAALSAMPEASTVESFQGRENDIIIVIMGTTALRGPGFTNKEQRLNVMLTRQRCGLVVIGDINVVGPMDSRNIARCGGARSAADEWVMVNDENGNRRLKKGGPLRAFYKAMYEARRWVRVDTAATR